MGRSVTVYVRDDAPESRALLEFLGEHDVSFDRRDALNPLVRQELFQRYGVLTLPVVVVGRRAFFGFLANREAIVAALGLGSR